ncbi:MAG TPA: hypothetical protein VGM29_17975 [Polyangiaceae bacterium]|jgi:hypothetical protein
MLVLLAPSFDGKAESFARLASVTGMVAYDLKSRIKSGSWGLVRALGDEAHALELATHLRQEGFPAFAVPSEVAHDSARRIIALRALELTDTDIVMHLRERSMPIPYAALTCVVRGEVQHGRSASRSSPTASSSATFRAVVPSATEVQVFRESLPSGNFDAFAAADLHFATVLWIARLDARSTDFSAVVPPSGSAAADLDRLVDELGRRAGVRVDRAVRVSSVASFAQQGGANSAPRSMPPQSVSPRSKEAATDERFDPYSRIIGEAERQLIEAQAQV